VSPGDEVTLWRAVPPGCRDPVGEVGTGYAAADYPGNGPYFATDRQIADAFALCYGCGIQELHIPRVLFEELVKRGVIQPDGYYPPGQSWHVPPGGLADFNAAIQQGTPNRYHPPPP
jgi:hypothetical protein